MNSVLGNSQGRPRVVGLASVSVPNTGNDVCNYTLRVTILKKTFSENI